MIDETLALTNRALKKWIRNPASVLPGLFTAAFYIALFGNSVNPTNFIPTSANGVAIPACHARADKRRPSSRRPSAGPPTTSPTLPRA